MECGVTGTGLCLKQPDYTIIQKCLPEKKMDFNEVFRKFQATSSFNKNVQLKSKKKRS
jgi:hypothetical protein